MARLDDEHRRALDRYTELFEVETIESIESWRVRLRVSVDRHECGYKFATIAREVRTREGGAWKTAVALRVHEGMVRQLGEALVWCAEQL